MRFISDSFILRAKRYHRRVLFKAKKLPILNEVFPKDYPNRVRIEISGTCNAKCLFCHSGKVPFDRNRRISPQLFENVVLHLKNINLLTKSVYLHSRGEPFMHRELGKILDICRAHNLNAVVSTNASKFPNLTRNQWRAIKQLKVSISGVTEKSYKLIYGLNLNAVLRNIEKIARYATPSCNLKINWLQYKFNREEEGEARKWLESLGFKFKPKSAYLIQMDRLIDLKEGRFSEQEFEDIKNYLLLDEERNKSLRQGILDGVKSSIQENKQTFICRQWDEIIINEDGELLKCCGVSPTRSENLLGNILNYSAEEVKQKKYEMNNTCKKCIEYGFAMPPNEVYSKIWNGVSNK
jgi:MoaA/NifB/PqqE/SkfB family radical SAM enzyme